MTGRAPHESDTRLKQASVQTSGFRDVLGLEAQQDFARRLRLDVRRTKPCWWHIGPQQQGRRGGVAHVLAVELLRAGAPTERVAAYLSSWADQCAQPGRGADHVFGIREVEDTVRSVVKLQESRGLRGYGCERTLIEWCPFESFAGCPYYRSLLKSRGFDWSSLVAVSDFLRRAPIPDIWSHQQRAKWTIARRKLLVVHIAALQTLKGHGTGDLITSEAELAWRMGCDRRTVRRDLDAMTAAKWIDFSPGISRTGTGGHPPRGCVIRLRRPEQANARA